MIISRFVPFFLFSSNRSLVNLALDFLTVKILLYLFIHTHTHKHKQTKIYKHRKDTNKLECVRP